VRARRAVDRPPQPDLHRFIEFAGASAPWAVVISEPGRTMPRLRRELATIQQAIPGVFPPLDAFLGGVRGAWHADLGSDDGLRKAGIDPKRPLAIVPPLRDAAMLITVHLADRSRFETWVAGFDEAAPKHTTIGGETVTIVGADSTQPIACAFRRATATCQIGEAPSPTPLAPLAAVLLGRGKAPTNHAAVRRALGELEGGADAYFVGEAEPIADALARVLVEHRRAARRFDTPELRRAAHEAAAADARLLKGKLQAIRGWAMAVSFEPDAIAADVELAMSTGAKRQLAKMVPSAAINQRLLGWTRTPALARILLRLQPSLLTDWLAQMGLELPVAAVRGEFAGLALALDTEAPAAKVGGPSSASALPCVVPTAAVIPLAQELAPAALGGKQRTITRALNGSPMELRLEAETLFVGTGAGAAAAATRRWRKADPTPSSGAGFMILELDPPAISAAIDAGAFGEDTRTELRMLSRLHQRLRPLLHHYRRVHFDATAHPETARLATRVRVLH